jgi:membrane associated rhomboid family serine protease/Zn-finger nucleic acid-binding protein
VTAAGPLTCPFDGVALDAAGNCRRCGAAWRGEADLSARAPTAFARLVPDAAADPAGQQRALPCPACGDATLVAWKLDALAVWMYRCPSCRGWLCPRGTIDTLARREQQIAREAAFASFSPEERAAMAREIAAESAAAAPEPPLPLVQRVLALLGLPVVTRIERERLPLVTWVLALVLIAVFVGELRGAGLDEAAARLGYGPDHRGLWAAVRATFAHAGWAHLIGNVYFLLAFGDGVEQRAPRWLLAPAFVVLGVAALLVDGLLHPHAVLLGASGGVAALMGACVVLQPRARVAIQLGPLLGPVLRLPMSVFFILALALQALLAALHVSGIAWTAHALGLVLGAASAALLRGRRSRLSARS